MEVDKRNGKPKQRAKDTMHLMTLSIKRRDKEQNDIKNIQQNTRSFSPKN